MVKDDTLWKGILENVFDDFLRFFFTDAHNLFDFRKGFEFLDKELEQLFPIEEPESPKFVDKLVKVFTQNGKEEWMLVHIEVQGYYDKHFAERMFTYFYRILDKYGKPITAIAIFSDNGKKFHPKTYEYKFLGTSIIYKFDTYKILEQDEVGLAKNENPFAIVILTVLLALKRKKINDELLFRLKLEIFRNLYRRNIPAKKMRGLHTFLKLYIHFAKPETTIKFERATDTITNNKNSMDIVEMVVDRAKKKGRADGIAEGIEKGKTQVVKNLLLAKKFTISEIADFASVTKTFVLAIEKEIK